MNKSITVNGHTWTYKRINNASYELARFHTIYEAYRHPSASKVAAYYRCKDLMREVGGCDMHITGHNSQTFSVMFPFVDRDTGELWMAWITRTYDYACPMVDCL